MDGFYYKNPSWRSERLVVRCDIDIEVYIKYHRPVGPSAILKSLSGIGLTHISVPCSSLKVAEGSMTSFLFGGEMRPAFNVTAKFAAKRRKRGYPTPSSHEGRFEIRPDNTDDEIIDND